MSVGSLLGIADILDKFSGGGPAAITADDLVPVLQDIKAGFSVVNDALDSADKQANLAVTVATRAGDEAGAIGQDVNDLIDHTYRVVIPHSLSWLAGYVVTTWIDPLRKDITELDHRVSFLEGWRGQIDSWRHTWVDPELRQWHGFRVWFDTWPRKDLTQLHEWMTKPATWGDYLAPYIVRPLVSWLLSKEHTIERDMVSLAMVDAWTDDPNLTWEAILRWVVKDTP